MGGPLNLKESTLHGRWLRFFDGHVMAASCAKASLQISKKASVPITSKEVTRATSDVPASCTSAALKSNSATGTVSRINYS